MIVKIKVVVTFTRCDVAKIFFVELTVCLLTDFIKLLISQTVNLLLHQIGDNLPPCRSIGKRNVEPLHQTSSSSLIYLLWPTKMLMITKYQLAEALTIII